MNKLLWALPILLISCGMSEEEIKAQREAQYKQDMASVQRQCDSFGYQRSDQFFPFCVQTQYKALLEARRAEYQQRVAAYQAISNAGRAMQGYSNSNQSSNRNGTAFFKSSYTQGFNKVCVYDRLGSVDTLVIGATGICPLTI